jgi:hypothetical protein
VEPSGGRVPCSRKRHNNRTLRKRKNKMRKKKEEKKERRKQRRKWKKVTIFVFVFQVVH